MTLWNWNTMVLAVGDAGRYVMINNACDTTCAVGQMQTTLATAPGTVSTTCTTPAADQICLSGIARDRHGFPLRVRAPQRGGCCRHDMGLILDFVPNHMAVAHPFDGPRATALLGDI